MEYPEHDKLSKIKEESNLIGTFLDTGLEDIVLARYDRHDNLYPIRESLQDLLAKYFNIDRDKLEAEKMHMLDEIRKNA